MKKSWANPQVKWPTLDGFRKFIPVPKILTSVGKDKKTIFLFKRSKNICEENLILRRSILKSA